jgi:hypothetical protein
MASSMIAKWMVKRHLPIRTCKLVASSANIASLIGSHSPQSVFYFWAWLRSTRRAGEQVVFASRQAISATRWAECWLANGAAGEADVGCDELP